MSRNVIVPEVLISLKNYDEWSICMKNYLIAQGLWDAVVECSSDSPPTERDWRKKNAAVLHALQISCAPEIFARIDKNNPRAKDAWDQLAKLYEQKYKWQFLKKGSLSGEGQEAAAAAFERWFEKILQGESQSTERTRYLPLLTAVFEKNWDAVMRFLYHYPQGKSARLQHDGSTVLHMVVSSGDMEALRKLLRIMSKQELETKNGAGETALAVCAIQGTLDIAKCLIGKNNNLISMADEKGMIPVVKACAQGNKDMTLLLYLATDKNKILSPDNGNHGSLLLRFCILNEMLDIALNLLQHHPRLAITSDHRGSNPILTLSAQPSRFRSGNKLPFFKRLIYPCIQVQPPSLSRDDRFIDVDNTDQKLTDNKTPGQIQSCNLWSMLKDVIGINQIHKQKFIHTCAREILRCMSVYLSTLNAKDLIESGVIQAIFQAVQHGIDEFPNEILATNKDLKGYHQKFILLHALEYRQEKFVDELSNLKTDLLEFEDKENNNVLHLVAKLAPESCLARIPGAALQMQREFQWFKEIESIVPQCKESVNLDGETPRQVFIREHKELVRRGEEWMKQTSQSYTVVGALIITVVFAAAFTIPGGNDKDGFPMFLSERLFSVFIISDAISLFGASTSVIMFLGILTSRYTEDDFLESLPRKLIIGLCALFISIVAMMIAFCDAVSIMLKRQQWIVITLISSAGIPVIGFLLLQSRLLLEILHSTYGWGLHKRKRFRIRNIIKSMRKLMTKKRV